MRVVFTRLATIDLEEIGDYIARDNPERALSFVEELRAQCVRIAQAPLSCAERPELGENLRSCVHGSYVIFFAVDDGRMLVVRVLHGARDLVQIFSGG
jgi:toxin ParE1/3/4